jgi:hypothetical protein
VYYTVFWCTIVAALIGLVGNYCIFVIYRGYNERGTGKMKFLIQMLAASKPDLTEMQRLALGDVEPHR